MPTGHPPRSRSEATPRRIGILSTFPPKLCGLATFAAALDGALSRSGDLITRVVINDARNLGPAVAGPHRHELCNGVAASVREAARVLSRCEVAIVQHEYGIYGGTDGDEVVDVLRALTVPAIVILHTVLTTPTPHQRSVLEEVCDLASSVVVMTATARARLVGGYDIDTSSVVVIPHGAATPDPLFDGKPASSDALRPQLLTWGLLGPGKGIEHVISSLALLQDVHPRINYTIAGATHPKVLAHEGERYRASLVDLAESLGVGDVVHFDDTYRDVPALTQLVASASVVVLPYDSRDQVTSGVLVDAIAAGRPVIATAFPHAVELLSDGAGTVVPHGDVAAFADAIRSVVTDAGRLDAMAARARQIAPTLRWGAVASRYRRMCDELVRNETAVAI